MLQTGSEMRMTFKSFGSCCWCQCWIVLSVSLCNQRTTNKHNKNFKYTFIVSPFDHTQFLGSTHTKSGVNRLAARSHPPTPPDFKLENSQFTELRRNSKLSSGNVALVLFALARRWAWLLVAARSKPEEREKGVKEEKERRETETNEQLCLLLSECQ